MNDLGASEDVIVSLVRVGEV